MRCCIAWCARPPFTYLIFLNISRNICTTACIYVTHTKFFAGSIFNRCKGGNYKGYVRTWGEQTDRRTRKHTALMFFVFCFRFVLMFFPKKKTLIIDFIIKSAFYINTNMHGYGDLSTLCKGVSTSQEPSSTQWKLQNRSWARCQKKSLKYRHQRPHLRKGAQLGTSATASKTLYPAGI